MDFLDFFGQPGVMSLCVMTIGSSVVLLVMVWWIVYRRNTRAKRERGELPPKAPKIPAQPAPARSRSGVWGAIVNFFMEPEDARKAKAPAPTGSAQESGAPESGAPESGTPAGARDGKGPSPDGSSAAVETAAQDPEPQEPAANGSTLGPVVSFSAPAATAAAAPAERPASQGRMPLPQTNAGNPAADPTQEPPADSVEVMRVWRDLADGSLIVDFGGARYRRLNDVPDPDLRRRFVGLVRNLNEMAGLEPEAATHAAPSAGGADSTDATLALPGLEEEAPPHMLRQLGRVFAGQTPVSATPTRAPGIVDEIEDFLQYKLQHTPALSDRSIHIRQSVTGVGVSIEVDGHFYEGVGDVVDPDVREFLQTTVQEWQNRQ